MVRKPINIVHTRNIGICTLFLYLDMETVLGIMVRQKNTQQIIADLTSIFSVLHFTQESLKKLKGSISELTVIIDCLQFYLTLGLCVAMSKSLRRVLCL